MKKPQINVQIVITGENAGEIVKKPIFTARLLKDGQFVRIFKDGDSEQSEFENEAQILEALLISREYSAQLAIYFWNGVEIEKDGKIIVRFDRTQLDFLFGIYPILEANFIKGTL